MAEPEVVEQTFLEVRKQFLGKSLIKDSDMPSEM
jgi:hypothetical protein